MKYASCIGCKIGVSPSRKGVGATARKRWWNRTRFISRSRGACKRSPHVSDAVVETPVRLCYNLFNKMKPLATLQTSEGWREDVDRPV